MFPSLVAALVVAGSMLGFAQWASWLGGRYGAPLWVRRLRWVFGAGAFAQLAVHYWAFRKLSGAIDRGTTVDPANKARLLAEGISEAMNGIALGILVALASLLVMLVLTWRYHWSAKVPKPTGEPPYR